ncbi:hypothetical protein [Candidatus Albibeggiatoa sp. nov. NOAA]|uniref:hypothetical protein n=1 Tax=Candidatus Albibeggiatoa sp. nov. NOAA TaxID=3162724 RepID=UPI0032F90788|nr:hypothetical protein [Thiotrichaceae bacterium]
MLPDKSDVRWKQLVEGDIQYNCELMAANMLLKRIVFSVHQDNSQQNIQQAIQETYQFFVHYQSILENDIANIFRD